MSKNILRLKGALIKALPENFSFQGTLDLTGSSLTELPKGLFVQEDLIIGDAQIHYIPENVIIGGDLIDYFGIIEDMHESIIVEGKFYYTDYILNIKSSNTQYIILDTGEKFFYKEKKHYAHKALRNHDFDRTPFNFYIGYSNKRFAVQWSTPKDTFTKWCKNKKDAAFLVNYQDAIERGIEQYKGLDIDTPILGHKILDIYQVCTHSCMPVIQEYLDTFGLSLDKEYTLREIGYKIQKFKIMRYAPASEVFMYFFNIPNYEKETE